MNALEEVRKLIEKDNIQEAIILLEKIEENTDLQQSELIPLFFYKAKSVIRLGNFPEALKYAKKVYRAIRKEVSSPQLVEILAMMGHTSCWLGNFEKGYQLLDEAEQKLRKLTDILEERRILLQSMIYVGKNCGYMQQGKSDMLYENAMELLSLYERIDDTFVLAEIYYQLGSLYTFIKIDINLAIKYSFKCQPLIEKLENNTLAALNLVTIGCIYIMTGDLEKALFYHEEGLKKTDIVMIKMSIFNNLSMIHTQKGELEKALESLDKAFELANKVNATYILMSTLASMIEVLVLMGRNQRAEKHLIKLKEIAEKEKNPFAELYTNFCEGFILKKKNRIQDRAKAQSIFEEIVKQEVVSGELTMKALINLCDLLVEEFRFTAELEVLDDLYILLEKLIDIAKNLNSFWILAETYLLQAKFSLLKGDLNSARKKLTEAQDLAEKNNLNLLMGKISYEHDKILKNLNVWESFIENDVPLKERIEIAELNVHIENMLLNRKGYLEISEEEPVIILIITEGGTPIFSHSFVKEKTFETQVISGFLTTIDYFIKETFSQGLDRAVFGDYTLLMKYVQPFYITYIFSGNSYYAHQRIKYFNEKMKNENKIWEKLMENYGKSKSLQIQDFPGLQNLIMETFVNKSAILEKY
ncbi:MAG: tetratricopeptide repeat protein [Promethearchaeota archaeon]|nr:MAG: tetratricopeptide repeat protein [Candidatus Lokiarchaeota archaeon]